MQNSILVLIIIGLQSAAKEPEGSAGAASRPDQFHYHGRCKGPDPRGTLDAAITPLYVELDAAPKQLCMFTGHWGTILTL